MKYKNLVLEALDLKESDLKVLKRSTDLQIPKDFYKVIYTNFLSKSSLAPEDYEFNLDKAVAEIYDLAYLIMRASFDDIYGFTSKDSRVQFFELLLILYHVGGIYRDYQTITAAFHKAGLSTIPSETILYWIYESMTNLDDITGHNPFVSSFSSDCPASFGKFNDAF